VAFGTDIDLALKLMEAAALTQPRVLRDPPNAPAALVVRFAESGIELELGIWIADPDSGQLDLRSALNRAIWQSFQANGIRVPFPQRELRVVGLPNGLGGTPAEVVRADPAG
jgi:small-conductance mechanosensitive channel